MTDPRFVLKPTAYLWAWRLSAALYAVSFLLPFAGWGISYTPGAVIFWWGMLLCYYMGCLPWWANPLFWAALGLSEPGPTWTAFTLALLAFLLSASYFFLINPVPGPAYWAWTGSMGVLAAGLGISLAGLDRSDHRVIEDDATTMLRTFPRRRTIAYSTVAPLTFLPRCLSI